MVSETHAETPIAMSRMPPPAEPDGPAALNPMLVALSRSNILHTRANGHVAFRSSLFVRTQLFLRKVAQIQPFLAVPH